jgi:hypothetical protein
MTARRKYKPWVRKVISNAEGLQLARPENPYNPGKLKVTFSFKQEGYKQINHTTVVALLDAYQLANLVEDARSILDAQVASLQSVRIRLSR